MLSLAKEVETRAAERDLCLPQLHTPNLRWLCCVGLGVGDLAKVVKNIFGRCGCVVRKVALEMIRIADGKECEILMIL